MADQPILISIRSGDVQLFEELNCEGNVRINLQVRGTNLYAHADEIDSLFAVLKMWKAARSSAK